MSLWVGNSPINTFACCLYYIILYYMASVRVLIYSSTRYRSILYRYLHDTGIAFAL